MTEGYGVTGRAWEWVAACARIAGMASHPGRKGVPALRGALVTERREQCRVLRDVIGNPFRPATLAPSWLTPTVVGLATQMYDSRDFSAMPILADALQDAGCEDQGIPGHCREPGLHGRGCWAVDLVLGKE